MSRPNISYPTPIPGPSTYDHPPSQSQLQAQGYKANMGLDPSPISRDTGGTSSSASASGMGIQQQQQQQPPRRTSGSSKSAGQYTSALDSSITRLLVTTKQLLQGLEQWSQCLISETDVSDVYVRLGNGFEVCIQAFHRAGISTIELDAIPGDLRTCLEQCLSYDQNHETLEVYLPEIRQIIYNLLHGLKQKQAAYKRLIQDRQRDTPSQATISQATILPAPTSHPPPPPPPPQKQQQQQARKPSRGGENPLPVVQQNDQDSDSKLSAKSGSTSNTSTTSPASINSQLPNTKFPSSSALAERGTRTGIPHRPAPPDAFRPPRMRLPENPQSHQPNNINTRRSPSPSPSPVPQAQEPIRHQLVDNPVPSPPPAPTIQIHNLSSSTSSSKPPPRPDRFSRDSYGSQRPVSRFSADSDLTNGSPIRSPPNRSPAKPSDPLAEEDEGEQDTIQPTLTPSLPVLNLPSALELPDESQPSTATPQTQSIEGLPDVPPETRATLAALQKSDALERRASKRFSSYTFNKMLPGSPGKKSSISSPQRPTRRADRPPPMPALPESLTNVSIGGRTMTDADDGISPTTITHLQANGDLSSRLSRPTTPTGDVSSDDQSDRSVRIVKTPDPDDIGQHATPRPRSSVSAPSPSNLSVFLQIGRQVKKASLESPISMSNLRLMFMERFEYDPGMEDFPDVYIRDNRTGVQFELEDMEDLREGCILSLNIEPLDQVKQHFDTTFGTLMQEIKDMKKAIDITRRHSMTPSPSLLTVSPSTQMSRPSTMVRYPSSDTIAPSPSNTAIPSAPRSSSPSPRFGPSKLTPEKEAELQKQHDELQSLRRDLAVMRQLHVDFLTETKESFGKLRNQNSSMRDIVKTKMGGNRALLDNSKTKLEAQCQDTIQSVEEISDMIDAVREDASKRYVTPSKSQMTTIKSDLEKARSLIDQLASDVQLADPMWRATWQIELHRVMEEQKLLSYQIKLCTDLKKDLEDVTLIFNNVQDFVNQRSTGNGINIALNIGRVSSGKSFNKSSPKELGNDTGSSPNENGGGGGGMNHLLMEIRTKETDPNSRLKAIEAQQKAREREKQKKTDEFEEELKKGGKKLKKTGGTEEAERMRQRRQELTLKRMINGNTNENSGVLSPQNTGNTQFAHHQRAISPQLTGTTIPQNQAQAQRALSPQLTGNGQRAITPQLTGDSTSTAHSLSNPRKLSPQKTGGSISQILSPNLTGGSGRASTSIEENVKEE
ncbi:uncharacterized protein IL334_000467 [Kwoniella shivajii]|uniref:Actin interacting protein 3 C-terminal domain-containing protein n=1 Tax=Kwoniella shivajii TaxID=564305 RepID=A0ABZ1CP90_9TREE|nr:hypothetical protein IL334_000467 [Kwoniella shivajii]